MPTFNMDPCYSYLPYCVYTPCFFPLDWPLPMPIEKKRKTTVGAYDPSLEKPKQKKAKGGKAVRFEVKSKQRENSLSTVSSSTGSTATTASNSTCCSAFPSRKDQNVSLLKYWLRRVQKKPYSAVTAQVEHLTSESYDEDDVSGIPELIEVVRLQSSGPTEAARALRKKLKYGSVHRQLRALTLLDGLIQNAGPRFQRAFADEPLLERLRVAGSDPVSDPDVKAKCKVLFGQWAVSYKNTPGLEQIASLYKQLPQRKKPVRQQESKVIRETEQEANEDSIGTMNQNQSTYSGGVSPFRSPNSPTTSTLASSHPMTLSPGPNLLSSIRSKKDKKHKNKDFSLEREKPVLLQTIASSSVASTNLMNSLKFINREHKRVSEDPEAIKRFDTCKQLRRQILRYIQHVESEDFLGSLIHANEELIDALMAYEVLDKSVENDSDSEDDAAYAAHEAFKQGPGREKSTSPPKTSFAGLSVAPPPKPARPGSIPMPPIGIRKGKQPAPKPDSESEESEADEDDDDPFGDNNAVKTPGADRRNVGGFTWKEV